MLGPMLATLHNLRYLLRLCEDMRAAIEERRWEAFRTAVLADSTPNAE